MLKIGPLMITSLLCLTVVSTRTQELNFSSLPQQESVTVTSVQTDDEFGDGQKGNFSRTIIPPTNKSSSIAHDYSHGMNDTVELLNVSVANCKRAKFRVFIVTSGMMVVFACAMCILYYILSSCERQERLPRHRERQERLPRHRERQERLPRHRDAETNNLPPSYEEACGIGANPA